ncbi:MAG TPA: response regulator [Ktedonobacterales bacterium]|jgi:CheY-like chemotaxis protein|nr:response regulator [Ktedonobacterales bacterium]
MAQVLVVEDDTPTREVLRLMLEDAGHQVSEAINAPAAIDLLRAAPTSWVVLVDLLLGAESGDSLLRTAAQDPALGSRHGYILTTASTPSLVIPQTALLESLAVEVVYKPFEIDHLLAAVDRAAARAGRA